MIDVLWLIPHSAIDYLLAQRISLKSRWKVIRSKAFLRAICIQKLDISKVFINLIIQPKHTSGYFLTMHCLQHPFIWKYIATVHHKLVAVHLPLATIYIHTLWLKDASHQPSTCVNSKAFASGSRVKIAGLPDLLSV